MKMKKRVSIMWLTIVPMVVLGLMAILTNMFSMKNISKVNTSGKQLANEHIVRITKLSEIENHIQTIHTYALSHVVATTFDTRVEMVAKIREETGSLDVTLYEYKEIMAPEDAMAYEQLCESYEQLKLEINQLMAYSANDEADQAYGMVNGIIQEHSHAMKENIESMIGNTKTAASDATEELGHVYASARMNTIVVIFVIIGCVCVSLFLVVYRFFKPLRKANKEINLIIESIDRSEGDLTRRIEIDANNEISDFANAVNTFLEKLQSIMKSIINNTVSMGRVISEVQESVRTSNDGVSDLSAVTEELAATMQEIGKSAGMINTNTSTVRTDVEMIAAKSNEINSYAKDMKLNANEMEENARNNMKETDIKVKDILEILNQAIEESKSVDQVNSLTNEILSISSQTNLLALNASIEAARAGEAGKGFAVVADEIRQLADSSRDTANRIQEINSVVTNAVHNLAGHANNLVEYMNDFILPEFSNFVESGEHYKENANYIENVMNEFANKTDSLKQEMDEIANSINTITSAIEEGANGVNGAAESTQQLVEDMEVISKKMDENATIEEDLKNETAIFTNF